MSRLYSLIFFICIILTIYSGNEASATHLRAGEITTERLNCLSLAFRITITVYIDTESGVTFGGDADWLYFGDGQRILVPETRTTPRPDLGQFMGMASFTVTHTYSSNGRYRISYVEPNRNANVLNIPGSIDVLFSVSTYLNLEATSGCNQNTPKLLIPPIDRACTGVAFYHNAGVYDLENDSLSYALVTPARDENNIVIGYSNPNDSRFYTNYNSGNEEGTGPPSFSINARTGTITWNSPGAQGEYNIAFMIIERRLNRITGVWDTISYTTRDMQIVVEDCNNERPDLLIPNDTCVEAGTTLKAIIKGIDPENHQVKIEAFSDIFILAPSQKPATYTPRPPVFQPSNPPAELVFEWNTDCMHVKSNAYQVVFKITDNPPNGPPLVTFKTWNIQVVAPAPQWLNAQADHVNRSASLQWNSYACSNAETIQVWRRVGSLGYEPDHCETGMPSFLGYELIEQVPASQTAYTDTNKGLGLTPGAQYCYRLVAVFPLPRGGESYVSEEICIEPIISDAPIITHVSVLKTDVEDGEIRVSWRSPLNIDENEFPQPYRYEVYRANGYAGDDGLLKVSNLQEDTTFRDIGMNTEDRVYNYRIVLHARTSANATYLPIDTSSTASTVRLDVSTTSSNVNLSWQAFVPWSNQTQQFPRHLIYRGIAGMSDDQFELLDSVHAVLNGLKYVDSTPKEEGQIYCYRVMTRGSYGNPAIEEPLENFSQTICVFPDENIAVCKPELFVKQTDCTQFLESTTCGIESVSNTLYWNRASSPACRGVVRSYKIYAANDPSKPFVLIASNVVDTFFVHSNLPSFAKCYRIAAVDRNGNESELSDAVCNDNCPYYELPNVFTPNGDGCNDRFSAYYDPGDNASGEEDCVVVDRNRCARFVEHVNFRVFNRWGKEVFTYSSGSENTIYINWNGKDNNGEELSTGVYYYVAEVIFNVVDPAKKNQTLKGWVHLMR